MYNLIQNKISKILLDHLHYVAGSKYYHTGFFDSREGTIEVFRDYNKELNIRCGVNEVFAFSRDGDLLHYSSKSLYDVISISCNKQQKIRDVKSTDCYSVVLFSGKVWIQFLFLSHW